MCRPCSESVIDEVTYMIVALNNLESPALYEAIINVEPHDE